MEKGIHPGPEWNRLFDYGLNATRGASGLVKRCKIINAKPKAFARICNLVDRLNRPRVVEPILVSIGDLAPTESVATESPRVDLELLKV